MGLPGRSQIACDGTITETPALTEFGEQSNGTRAPGTAVRPEDDVVRVGIPSALKEEPEQMVRFNVDVPSICPGGIRFQQLRIP